MMFVQKKNTVLRASALALCTVFAFASGCNSGTGTNSWSIEGVQGPTVTYGTNQITVSAVLQNIQVQVGATIAIPDMPNSSIEVAPDVTGGLLLQLSISAADVAALSGTTTIPPQELPGGRPLPGVTTGELPAIAIQVPQLDNVTFYLGPQVFGAFIPVKFDLKQIIGTYQFYGSSNANIGQISMVGEDASGANSGFLLLLNIGDLAQDMAAHGNLRLPLN